MWPAAKQREGVGVNSYAFSLLSMPLKLIKKCCLLWILLRGGHARLDIQSINHACCFCIFPHSGRQHRLHLSETLDKCALPLVVHLAAQAYANNSGQDAQKIEQKSD